MGQNNEGLTFWDARTGKTRNGRSRQQEQNTHDRHLTVPAIELVSLVHPTEHARYTHKQAALKGPTGKQSLTRDVIQFSLTFNVSLLA